MRAEGTGQGTQGFPLPSWPAEPLAWEGQEGSSVQDNSVASIVSIFWSLTPQWFIFVGIFKDSAGLVKHFLVMINSIPHASKHTNLLEEQRKLNIDQ